MVSGELRKVLQVGGARRVPMRERERWRELDGDVRDRECRQKEQRKSMREKKGKEGERERKDRALERFCRREKGRYQEWRIHGKLIEARKSNGDPK